MMTGSLTVPTLLFLLTSLCLSHECQNKVIVNFLGCFYSKLFYKLPASRISNRMAFVRKADIEKMLAGNMFDSTLAQSQP